MNARRWGAAALGLATFVFFVWIDPGQIYTKPSHFGSLLLILLLGAQTSPWVRWQGALPFDRRRWLAGEFVQSSTILGLLVGLFWLSVAWLKAGTGWGNYLAGGLTTVLATLSLLPWPVVIGLGRTAGGLALSPAGILGTFVLMLWILGVSLLGDTFPGSGAIALAVVGDLVSFVAAWLWALRRLKRGN